MQVSMTRGALPALAGTLPCPQLFRDVVKHRLINGFRTDSCFLTPCGLQNISIHTRCYILELLAGLRP